MKRILTLFLLQIVVSIAVFSAPYCGMSKTYIQPDGTKVEVKLFGDEFYSRYETPDGYTVVRDSSGWVCYATLSGDGTKLISTGKHYTLNQKELTKLELAKHIDINPELISNIITTNRANLEQNQNKVYSDSGLEKSSRYTTEYKTITGKIKGLVILIDFVDNPATISKDSLEMMFNQRGFTGYDNRGSVRDYFTDASFGKLDYENVFYGYIRAPKRLSEYANMEMSAAAEELLDYALHYIDSRGFDFSTLTTSDNKKIRSITIWHNGRTLEDIHGHAGWYKFSADGVSTERYSIVDDNKIGVFCHEAGHMLGNWPDNYRHDPPSGNGIWSFDLMGGNHDHVNPSLPNPYFRYLAGWLYLVDCTEMTGQLKVSINRNFVYAYYKRDQNDELYIIEVRRSKGRDELLSDEGLTIWRIDKYGSNQTDRREVSLIHANNNEDDDENICFRAGLNDNFSAYTTPAAIWYNGSRSDLIISEISEVGDEMTFRVGNTHSNEPFSVPGRIEAEDFNYGGEGFGYHDIDNVNNGGAYRNEGVDLYYSTEGNVVIGGFELEEWTKYSVNIQESGEYRVFARASSPYGANIIVGFDNHNVNSQISVPNTGDWNNYGLYEGAQVYLEAGTEVITMSLAQFGVNIDYIRFEKYIPTAQVPFFGSPLSITQFVQAENYDYGGEGIAYHDTDVTNTGGVYRSDGVDLYQYPDETLILGWFELEEWTEYTISVPVSGNYRIIARAASPYGANLALKFDNSTSTQIYIPNTGDWGNYDEFLVNNVYLTAGTKVMKMSLAQFGINVDYIRFESIVVPVQEPYFGYPMPITQVVEAENYDNGGEGLAYHDTDNVNTWGVYRSDGVDLNQNGDNSINIGLFELEEWTEYTISVQETGYYTIIAKAASPNGANLYLTFDNGAYTEIYIPNTGGWDNYGEFAVDNVYLTAGTKVMRMGLAQYGINVDYIRFGRNTSIPYGQNIALLAAANNKYVCADFQGTAPLIANRDGKGEWETFYVVDVGVGHIALLALANNQYVSCGYYGDEQLIASQTGIAAGEIFKWFDNGDGSISLRAYPNNMFVCAEGGGEYPLIANRETNDGPWERFYWENSPGYAKPAIANNSVVNLKNSKENQQKSVIIWPNPFKDVLNIKLKKRELQVKIEIYNQQGQLLYSNISKQAEKISIPRTEIKGKGTCIIKLITTSGTEIRKILLE